MDLNKAFKLEELRSKINNTSINNYEKLSELAKELKATLGNDLDNYYNSNLSELIEPYLKNYTQNNQAQTYNEQTRTI